MSKETLFEATQRLLKNYPRHYSLSQIARESGVKPSWLSAFSRNAIPDPGIHKVQQLYNWLIVDRPLTTMTIKSGEWVEKLPMPKPGVFPPCVYIVWAENEPLYVGCSSQIRSRLLQHSKLQQFIDGNMTHVELTFFAVDQCNIARAYEKDRIQFLQPRLNIIHTDNVAASKPIV